MASEEKAVAVAPPERRQQQARAHFSADGGPLAGGGGQRRRGALAPMINPRNAARTPQTSHVQSARVGGGDATAVGFPGARYNDLLLFTQSPDQRILMGTDLAKPATFKIDSSGADVSGTITVRDKLRIVGELDMVGGFQIDNGIFIAGGSTFQPYMTVLNSNDQLLLNVDDGGIDATRSTRFRSNLLVNGDTRIDGDLNLQGEVTPDTLATNALDARGKLRLFPAGTPRSAFDDSTAFIVADSDALSLSDGTRLAAHSGATVRESLEVHTNGGSNVFSVRDETLRADHDIEQASGKNARLGGDLTLPGDLVARGARANLGDGTFIVTDSNILLSASNVEAAGSVLVAKDLSVGGDADVAGKLLVRDGLDVREGLELRAPLLVKDASNAAAPVLSADSAKTQTWSDELRVWSDLYVRPGGTLDPVLLSVTGSNENVTVDAFLRAKRDVRVDGGLSVDGTLHARSNSVLQGRVRAEDDLDVGGGVVVRGGELTVERGAFVNLRVDDSRVTLGRDTEVLGDLSVSQDLITDGKTTLRGAQGALVENGPLEVRSAPVLASAAPGEDAPSYSWTSRTDAGMFLAGSNADAVGFSTRGRERLRVTPEGDVRVLAGGAKMIADGFAGSGAELTDLNADNVSSGVLDVARGGTGFSNAPEGALLFGGSGAGPISASPEAMLWDAGARRLDVGSSNPANAGSVRVRGGDVILSDGGGGFLADESTAASPAFPSFAWSGDRDTGLFLPSNDTLAFSTGSYERLRITSDGRVGLNVPFPSARLHVAGDVAIDGSLVSGNMSADRVTSGTLPVARGGTGASVLNTSKLLVGAGTCNVAAPAELHWDAVERRLGVHTDAPSSELDVVGMLTATALRGDGSGLSNLNADAVRSGVLETTRGGTGNSGLARGKVVVGGGSNGEPALTPTELHWDASNARLGVGTQSPTSAVDVSGRVTALSFAGQDGSRVSNLNMDLAGTGELSVARGGTGRSNLSEHKLLVGAGACNVVSPDGLHWDADAERLGIHTSNPGAAVDVRGDLVAARLFGDGAGVSNLDADRFGSGTTDVIFGGTGRSNLREHKLLVGRGDQPVEHPDDLHWDGLHARLGVRTSNPQEALDVRGTAKASAFVGDASGLSGLNMDAAALGVLDVSRGGTGRSNVEAGRFVVGAGSSGQQPLIAPSNLYWDDAQSRLGVRTTAPQSALDVAGTARAALFSGSGAALTNLNADRVVAGVLPTAFGGTGTSGLKKNKVVVGAGPTSPSSQPDDLHWDGAQSRLGVRAIDPQAALDVRGDVKAFAFAGDGSSVSNLNMDAAGLGVLAVERGGTGGSNLERGKLLVGRDADPVEATAALHWDFGTERLGVGTSNPERRLDVRGGDGTARAERFEGADASGLSNLNVDLAGVGVLAVPRGGTGASELTRSKVLVGDGTSAVRTPSDLHWDDSNRRLGVNRGDPAVELDVAGTVRADFLEGDGSSITNLDMDAAGLGVLAVQRGGTGRSNVSEHKLMVGRGTADVLTPSALHWDEASQRLGVGTDTPDAALDIDGDVIASGTFSGSGAGLRDLDMDAVSSGVLSVKRGGTGRGSHAEAKLLVGRGSNAVASPAELHWDSASGHLGVRTSNPQTEFDVAGTVRADFLQGDGSSISNLDMDAAGRGTLSVDRGGTGKASLPASKLLVGDGTGAVRSPSELHWDQTQRRLGVGTASPQAALDVGGGGSARVGRQVLASADTSVLDSASAPAHSWAGDPDTGMFLVQAGTIGFSTKGAEHARITDAGRLGVGTSNPDARLHVAGDVAVDGEIISGDLSADRVTSGVLPVPRGGTGASSHARSRVLVGDGSNALTGAPGLRWEDDGNGGKLAVGDSVASLAQLQHTLDVGGSLRAASLQGDGSRLSNLSMDNASLGTLAVPRGGTGKSQNAFGKLLIGRGTDPLLSEEALHWDSSARRLGVHTSNPTSEIEVVGRVTATSFEGDGSLVSNLDMDAAGLGTLSVRRGGTGRGELTSNKVLVGDGTNFMQSPTQLHWDGSNERLGIGTDIPEHALDVTSSDGVVRAARFLGDGSGLSNLHAANVASGELVVPRGGTGRGELATNKLLVGHGTNPVRAPSDLHWDDVNARLGVGESNPQARVHVDGTVMATAFWGDGSNLSNVDLEASTAGVLPVSKGGTGSNAHARSKVLVGDDADALRSPPDLHWDLVASRLGVRTSNPRGALDVRGTLFADLFRGDGRGITDLDMDQAAIGRLSVKRGGTGSSNLKAGRVLVGSGSNAVSSPELLHWDDTNARLGVGVSPPQHALHVAGRARTDELEAADGSRVSNLNMDAAGVGDLAVEHGGTGRSNLAAGRLLVGDGTSALQTPDLLHWDGTNARLGVGVSPPQHALHVAGRARADELQAADGSRIGNLNMDAAGVGDLAVEHGGTGRSNLAKSKLLVGDGTSSVDTPELLHWDGTNARLGVGTTAPREALDVRGSAYASDQFLGSRPRDSSNAPAFSWREDPDTGMFHPDDDDDHLAFATRGEERVRVTEWGFVGINTRFPQSALHVSGNVNIDGAILSAEMSADVITSGVLPVTRGGTGSGEHTDGKILVGTGSNPVRNPSDLHWDAQQRRLGVRTSNPRGALEVDGKVYATAFQGDGSALTNLSISGGTTGVLPVNKGGTGLSNLPENRFLVGDAQNDPLFPEELLWDRFQKRLGVGARFGGASTPRAALEVDGNVISVQGFSVEVGADASNAPAFTWVGDDDTGMYRPDQDTVAFSTAGTERARFDASGRFGLGTASPSAALHVASGDFALDGTMVSGSMDAARVTSGFFAVPRGGTGRSSLKNDKVLVGDGTSAVDTPDLLHWDGTNNRLGVGTSNPSDSLDVAGTVRADAFVGDGSGLTNVRVSAITNQNGNVFGVPVGGTGASNLARHKLLIGNAQDPILTDAALHYDPGTGRLGVGTASPLELLDVAGSARVRDQVLANPDTDAPGLPAYSWRGDEDTGLYRPGSNAVGVVTDGTERARFDASGRFGLGTSNPAARLHVASGDFALDGTMVSGSMDAARVTSGFFAVPRGGTGRSSLKNDKVLVGDGTSAVDTPDLLHWDGTNNRLGVGTSNPSESLDVVGTVKADAFVGDGSGLTNVSAGSVSGDGVIAVTSGGTGTSNLADSKVLVGAGTADVLSPELLHWSSGNNSLGVGVTNPQERLDVDGSVRFTYQLVSSNVNDASSTPSYTWEEDRTTGIFSPSPGGIAFSSATNETMRIASGSGFVGINTSNPDARLHVAGDFALDGTMVSGSMDTARVTTGVFPVERGGTGRSSFTSNKLVVGDGSDPLYAAADLHWDVLNARLGIGTNAPSQKLQVNGGVTADRYFGDGCNLTNLNVSNVTSGVLDVVFGGTGTSNLAGSKLLVGNSDQAVRTPTNLHWNGANERLGVGTDAPQDTLHVFGSVLFQSGYDDGQVKFEADAVHRGKIVVQDGQDGGASRGIYMWTSNENARGIYMASSGGNGGTSLVGGNAVSGYGFADLATRFRIDASSNHGFVFENALEQRLLSVRGNDGLAFFSGDTIHDGRVVVQNEKDGGMDAGVLLWSADDTRFGLYVASHSNGDSLGGNTPVRGYGDVVDLAVRLRVPDSEDHGFVVENASEDRLVSVRGNDGLAYFAGDVVCDARIVVHEGLAGGAQRGIRTWTLDNTDRGLYLGYASTGQSMAGAQAVTGRGFSGLATRFRMDASDASGFIFENGAEQLLVSVRGSDGLTQFSGDVIHNGKIVVQDGQDGGSSRGIYMNTSVDSSRGIYQASSGSGNSLDDGSAVAGRGFTGLSTRFRMEESGNAGFIFENSVEQHLISVRGSDGLTQFSGDVIHNGKIVVQDGQDGGSSRGIYLDTINDTNRGIYHATSGTGNSLADGSAVAGRGFSGAAARLRMDNSSSTGFVFENDAEELLMSMRGSDGLTQFSGDVIHNGKIVVQDGQDGGTGRGLHLWTLGDTRRGIYMATSGSGNSLSGGNAVSGYGFGGIATRLRIDDNGSRGILFENDSEQRLFSVRGSDGYTSVRGDAAFGGHVNVTSNVNLDQGSRLRVTDSTGRHMFYGPGENRATGASVVPGTNVADGETFFAVESTGGANRFGVTQQNGVFVRDSLQVGFAYDQNDAVSTPPYKLDVNGTARATAFRGDGSNVENLNMNNASLGILNVDRGGTGAGSHTDNKLLVGNGNSAIQSPSDLHWDAGNNRLGIGTTTPSSKLYVNGEIRTNDDVVVESDARIKTNLRPIRGAMESVEQLNGYIFNRTDRAEKEQGGEEHDYMGLVAQEVLPVAPEVVKQDRNTKMYGVAYANMVALLVEALKDVRGVQRKQEAEIAELKRSVSSLSVTGTA